MLPRTTRLSHMMLDEPGRGTRQCSCWERRQLAAPRMVVVVGGGGVALAVVETRRLFAVLLLAADSMRLGLERVHVAAVILLQGHCERCGDVFLDANTTMG